MIDLESAEAGATASPQGYGDVSFQAIVEQSIVGVYVIQDERFQYVNATFAGFLGCRVRELVGTALRAIIPEDFLAEFQSIYRRRIAGELQSARYVCPARHRLGGMVRLEVHGSRMDYRGRPAVVGVGIDVTERVHREDELRTFRTELQALTSYINRMREDQRAKFARELHDVLGGLLAAIRMDVTRLARRMQDAELIDITRGLMDLTQETIDTVREMSEELRPSGLDHLGLCETMRRELARFGARYGIQCAFSGGTAGLRLPTERATSIYRIYQESLANIARHAGASRVDVGIEWDAEEFRMQVLDDGCGIADEQRRRPGAFGILGMRERTRDLAGALEIGLRHGGGTRLCLVVPLHGSEAAP